MTTYTHYETCPNYARSRDSALCTCEARWDRKDQIIGLEKIQRHLTELFTKNPEPTLFEWAEIVNGYYVEDEDDSFEVDE
jgi:hypothetical protein